MKKFVNYIFINIHNLIITGIFFLIWIFWLITSISMLGVIILLSLMSIILVNMSKLLLYINHICISASKLAIFYIKAIDKYRKEKIKIIIFGKNN